MTIQKLNNKDTMPQSGRSMVEMLGVLAIIGVLSIGGIAGYSYGMDKYRANETINEINMRLMTLKTQSERDMDLNLNEFSDTTSQGYMIADNYDWAEDDTRVYVGVSGIPKQVCEIIYDEMITKVERIDVTADITTDADTLCGDNNEMKFYIASGMHVECDPACAEDEYCASGVICLKEERIAKHREKCTTDADCSECSGTSCMNKVCWKEVPTNGTECDGGNGICVSGICTPKEEVDTTCTQNSDCPLGQYCALKNSWGCSATPYGCAPIELTPTTITLSNGQQETWYMSKYVADWYNAKAMCEALGKKMPTKADFVYLDRIEKLRKQNSGILWTSSEKNCAQVWVTTSNTGWGVQAKGNYYSFTAVCR